MKATPQVREEPTVGPEVDQTADAADRNAHAVDELHCAGSIVRFWLMTNGPAGRQKLMSDGRHK